MKVARASATAAESSDVLMVTAANTKGGVVLLIGRERILSLLQSLSRLLRSRNGFTQIA